jgi:hypothetical protein
VHINNVKAEMSRCIFFKKKSGKNLEGKKKVSIFAPALREKQCANGKKWQCQGRFPGCCELAVRGFERALKKGFKRFGDDGRNRYICSSSARKNGRKGSGVRAGSFRKRKEFFERFT